MNTLSLRKQASKLVLAIALATGTAMIAGHIVPDEAHAQRNKKKKKKDKEEEQPQPEYSKEWREAFVPLSEKLTAEGADFAALQAELEKVVALSKSGDERLQTGQLIYNAGIAIDDLNVRLRGMEMMIGSGKVPANAEAQYNFIAYQLANNLKDNDKELTYLTRAIELGYTTETITASDLQVNLALYYFNSDNPIKGLEVLDGAIEGKKAAGETVEERIYAYAFSIALRQELKPQVYDYAIERAIVYPSQESWQNAVGVVRNLNEFDQQQALDMLRLSRKVGLLNTMDDAISYVEFADPRRLPKEVIDVINEGYASGVFDRDDPYVADQLRIAQNLITADQADLPEIEADAHAADASVKSVAGAATAFLSYGQYDKAVTLYEKALGMPGVDTNTSLTRLGMAQIETGDFEGAKETFAKVQGAREPLARVWAGYAEYMAVNAGASEPEETAAL